MSKKIVTQAHLPAGTGRTAAAGPRMGQQYSPHGAPGAAVIAAEGESGFRLTAEDEDELFAALQDIDNGNYEDGCELLRELKALSR